VAPAPAPSGGGRVRSVRPARRIECGQVRLRADPDDRSLELKVEEAPQSRSTCRGTWPRSASICAGSETISVNVGAGVDQWIDFRVQAVSAHLLASARRAETDYRGRLNTSRFLARVFLLGAPAARDAARQKGEADRVEWLLRRFRHKPGLVDQVAKRIFELSGYELPAPGPRPASVSSRHWRMLNRFLNPVPHAFAEVAPTGHRYETRTACMGRPRGTRRAARRTQSARRRSRAGRSGKPASEPPDLARPALARKGRA
jgi:hypothetical protein